MGSCAHYSFCGVSGVSVPALCVTECACGCFVVCVSVYSWTGLAGLVMLCADGEQEGEDSSL